MGRLVNRYTNPFPFGPAIYETDARPFQYSGFEIYHRLERVWDVVKDGVCIHQAAGIEGAKRHIDALPAEVA